MVFDNPLARLRIIAGEERYTDICSVHVRQWAANADDSPPGTGSDQLTQSQSTESPGEQVAIRCRIFIDQTNLRTYLYGIRNSTDMVRTTTHGQTIRFAGKTFQDHRRYISTTIGTVVDDQTFLIQLRIEITGKFI